VRDAKRGSDEKCVPIAITTMRRAARKTRESGGGSSNRRRAAALSVLRGYEL